MQMKPDFGIWDKLPDSKIANMIDSKVTRLEELVPSENIIREIGNQDESKHILDFGCGIGRNIIGINKAYQKWHVVGFDNQKMIELARVFLSGLDFGEWGETWKIRLSYDWSEVLEIVEIARVREKFDTIFCCVSLQHIPEPQLREYLADFKKIGKELFVFGRRAIDPDNSGGGYDGGENFVSVWDVILDSGFEIINAQDGFAESSSGFNKGNGNDHHWVRFKPKEEINVRYGKRKRSF